MPKPSKKRRLRKQSVEEAFGAVLRELRLDVSLSQEQLGFELDSGRTYISELERGIRTPTLRWLFRLATYMEVSPSEIVRRTETRVTD